MKFFVTFLAIVALANGASVQTKGFQDEVEDFMAIIGELVGEQIFQLIEEYQTDEDYLKTLEWLRTADFDGLLTEMESLAEFNAVIDVLENIGIDARYIIGLLHEAASGERKTRTAMARQKTGTGFSGYLKDLSNILPHNELRALFAEKIESDPEFQMIVNTLNSADYTKKWDALFSNSVFIKELDQLKEHGIDVWLIIDIILETFGADA